MKINIKESIEKKVDIKTKTNIPKINFILANSQEISNT